MLIYVASASVKLFLLCAIDDWKLVWASFIMSGTMCVIIPAFTESCEALSLALLWIGFVKFACLLSLMLYDLI